MLQHSSLVCVKEVKGKGRGVFARQAIARDTVLETVPVLLIPIAFVIGGFDNPELMRFFFIRDDTTLQVPLGFGSIYNHSYQSNADYKDGPGATMVFWALRDIAADEEITINYNGFPGDMGPMHFDVV